MIRPLFYDIWELCSILEIHIFRRSDFRTPLFCLTLLVFSKQTKSQFFRSWPQNDDISWPDLLVCYSDHGLNCRINALGQLAGVFIWSSSTIYWKLGSLVQAMLYAVTMWLKRHLICKSCADPYPKRRCYYIDLCCQYPLWSHTTPSLHLSLIH